MSPAGAVLKTLADEKVVWGSYLRARKVTDSRLPLLKSPKTVESKGFFYLRGHQFWRRLSRMESLRTGRTLRGAELIFSINDIERVEMSFTPSRSSHTEGSLSGEHPTYERRGSNMSTETSHAWDENASDWTSDAVTVGGNEDALLHALEEGSTSMSAVDGKMLVFLSMKAPTPGQVVEFRSSSARELICLRDELNDLCMLKARQSTSSSCSFTSFSSMTGMRGLSGLSGGSPAHSTRSSAAPIAPPRTRGAGSNVESGKIGYRRSKQRKPTRSSKTSKHSTLSERKLSL